MVWQTTQVIHNTLMVSAHAPLSVRQQYGRAAYADLRAFVGPHGWPTGAEPVPYWPGVRRWFDDNDAVGQDLVIAYDETGLRYLLKAAQGVMWFVHTGAWHKGDRGGHPGGVYWNQKRRYRTANTEAGVIHFALMLYTDTRYRRYLLFAKQVYAWTRATLGTPSGRYREQIGPRGVITGSAFLSSDALMVSNGMTLCGITHRSEYCAQAEKTAAAAAHQYGLKQIEHDSPAYDSMYFYNTQRFSHATLGAYVAYVRPLVAPTTGLFSWRYPFSRFPTGGCVASFSCRQQQAAQAGVVGAMVLWNRNPG